MAISKKERGVTDRGVVISRPTLADLLSIQIDTISSLDKKGLFDGSKATEYDRDDAGLPANFKHCYWSKNAIEAYYSYAPLTEDMASQMDSKSRKEEAEAVIAEVKAATAIGEVASLEEITRITGDSLTLFKEMVLALPTSVISELVAADNQDEMLRIMQRECNNVLTQLAGRFANLRESLGEYDDE